PGPTCIVAKLPPLASKIQTSRCPLLSRDSRGCPDSSRPCISAGCCNPPRPGGSSGVSVEAGGPAGAGVIVAVTVAVMVGGIVIGGSGVRLALTPLVTVGCTVCDGTVASSSGLGGWQATITLTNRPTTRYRFFI